MTQWQPGMIITAGRLNDGLDPVTTASGATAATNFTLVSFSGRRAGRQVTINFSVALSLADVYTNDIHADVRGNLADTALGTLPVGWRPPELVYCVIGDGFGSGECFISTTGVITVRSWNNDDGSTPSAANRRGIVVGRNLRVTAAWLADS